MRLKYVFSFFLSFFLIEGETLTMVDQNLRDIQIYA